MTKRSRFFLSPAFSGTLGLCFAITVVVSLVLSPMADSNRVTTMLSFDSIASPRLDVQTTASLQQYDVSIPRNDSLVTTVNGIIEPSEYDGSFFESVTGMYTYWVHNSVNLSIGIISQGRGWVAIGFGEEMDGASMIMGGVFDSDNSIYCYDLIGTGGYSPGHGKDIDEGGEDNVLEYYATQNTTHTVLEFIIPLDSGDANDTVLEMNQTVSFFLGFQETSDDYLTYHSTHSLIISAFISIISSTSTNIVVSTPNSVLKGNLFEIGVHLVDNNLNPLTNMNIEFFMRTSFGDYIIGTNITDSNGDSKHNFSYPYLVGNYTFGAKFRGMSNATVEFRGSENSQTIIFFTTEIPEPDLVKELFAILFVGIIASAFVSIWIVYGINAFTLIRFWRARHQTDPDQKKEEIGSDNA
ncbi:MAG: DOMON domain-containing protein [Candidatus Odinarchaeota archaeon]